MSRTDDEDSFFVQERDRLASEITSVNLNSPKPFSPFISFPRQQGFEELLSLTNVFNRQAEEVFSMSAEYETVANLWNSFHQIVQDQDEVTSTAQPAASEDARSAPLPTGLPGTGTHVLTDQIKENA